MDIQYNQVLIYCRIVYVIGRSEITIYSSVGLYRHKSTLYIECVRPTFYYSVGIEEESF